MITVDRKLDIAPSYDFDLVAPKERLVFFDIETTGLSASKSGLYLIGAVHYEEGEWRLLQYFAESMLEEEQMLESFFSFLDHKKEKGRVFLIGYNSDSFDIPFINKLLSQYGLDHSFAGTFSIDLFRKLRATRKLTGLKDLKLKTVERFVGIYREDKYSGGELIYVYEEYLRLKNIGKGMLDDNDLNHALMKHMEDTLLLHNAEDMINMPLIMDVLSYDDLLTGNFTFRSAELIDGVLDMHFRLLSPLPREFYFEEGPVVMCISGEDPLDLNLTVRIFEGELKYYFADYKNYYYLPAEDTAIHKTLGEFVDKKSRKQATARNCYQRRRGLYIPEFSPVFTPVLYDEYKGKMYGPYTDEIPESEDQLKKYVLSIITYCNSR